jgi:hypothetical protein
MEHTRLRQFLKPEIGRIMDRCCLPFLASKRKREYLLQKSNS